MTGMLKDIHVTFQLLMCYKNNFLTLLLYKKNITDGEHIYYKKRGSVNLRIFDEWCFSVRI